MTNRILVVEDSATQAEALRSLLVDHGFEVKLARSAEEALELIVPSELDLVLSDVIMPGMDGYELCRRIKAQPDEQYELPVVLLTSLGDPLDILRGLECGADNYVIKPYEEDLLLARIAHVLGKRRLRRGGKASMGVNVTFLDTTFTITSDRDQILDLFISSIEDIVRTNSALQESQRELRAAQEKLEEYANEMAQRALISGEKYSTLMQHASDAIFVLDQGGRIVEANARASGLLGISPESLRGHPLAQFAPPEWGGRLREKIERLETETRLTADDFALVHRSGRLVRCDLSASRAPGEGEHLLLLIVRDQTERRRAEEALHRSEERYRLLGRATEDVIWEWDPLTDRIEWNAAMSKAFRFAPEDVITTMTWWCERIHPDDAGRTLAGIRALAGGELETWTGEYRVRRGDGGFASVLDRAFVVRDEAGQALRIIGCMVDLTEQKHLEDQLRQAQKMEAVGQLAGGIAHDFNNLLTAIKGFTQLVLDDLPPGTQSRDDLEQIDKAASRAAALTGQLLAFSRRQVLHPTALNLNGIIAGLEKMLRRLLRENIRVVTTLSPALGVVRADAGQVEQVIVNLAINAGDAMPSGGVLTIETRMLELAEPLAYEQGVVKAGSHVQLTVSDTGTGMDHETMTHIFEPFFTTKGEGRGTGLGLSTVYGIVKQSGGHLWVESELGRGSTFSIVLPCTDADDASPASGEETSARSGTETVLAVEDEEAVGVIIRRTLVKHGYAVLHAPDGIQAMQVAEEHGGRIDLLISDIVMPGMDGPDLVERILARHPRMRVLYISGYTEHATLRRGVLTGQLEFLSKPFTPDRLARKVREVLDAPRSK